MKTLEELKIEIASQVKHRRVRKPSAIPKEKPHYLGVCFFDDYGYAWLYIDGDTRCIGREIDVREACKKYNTDVENPSDIKNAMIRRARESKNHICHLRSKNTLCEDLPIQENGKYENGYLEELLDGLIRQGLGIWAIHSKIKDKGYRIPMRTLGRRVRERRQLVLV
jgi:hypothetical protein